jgi:hypothetical protein
VIKLKPNRKEKGVIMTSCKQQGPPSSEGWARLYVNGKSASKHAEKILQKSGIQVLTLPDPEIAGPELVIDGQVWFGLNQIKRAIDDLRE